jgi:hypothetical protein
MCRAGVGCVVRVSDVLCGCKALDVSDVLCWRRCGGCPGCVVRVSDVSCGCKALDVSDVSCGCKALNVSDMSCGCRVCQVVDVGRREPADDIRGAHSKHDVYLRLINRRDGLTPSNDGKHFPSITFWNMQRLKSRSWWRISSAAWDRVNQH